MRIEKHLGPLSIEFGVHRLVRVHAVQSRLEDGRHVLMWDFDGLSLDHVTVVLKAVQDVVKLSDIFILSSGDEMSYHAYCGTAKTFEQAAVILLNTPGIDPGFLRIGIYRGFWDLRFTKKGQRYFEHVGYLPSPNPPDVDLLQMSQFVTYWARPR